MASRLEQFTTKEVPTTQILTPTPTTGSRLGMLLEKPIIPTIPTIPTIPKPVELFPSTMQVLSELQIDPLSLKADPKKVLSKTWESLKTTVSESAPKIVNQFTKPQTIGERLRGIAAGGHLVFSPITALFEGANQVPVLGSVSRLIGTAFIAVGEGAADIAGKIVDELPIPDKQIVLETGKITDQKQDIKEGIQEITSLAAMLALGKATHIGSKKFNELKGRFGEKDATTIVNKANELAKLANEPVPPEVIKAEVKPIEVETIKKVGVPEVPKETQPLAQEARKYKTAEDFSRSFPDFGGKGANNRYIIGERNIADLKMGDNVANIKPVQLKRLSAQDNPPIIVRGNTVLDGHHRLELAKQRGDTTIKTLELTNDTNKGQSLKEIYNSITQPLHKNNLILSPKSAEIPESIPKELHGLATEARKYKSAEEFMKDRAIVKSLLPKESIHGPQARAKFTGEIANVGDTVVDRLPKVLKKGQALDDVGGDGSVGNYTSRQVAKLIKNGRLTVYHGTTETTADILRGNVWSKLNDGSYLSLTKDASRESLGVYGAGYYKNLAQKYGVKGEVLKFEIPIEHIGIDKVTGELRFINPNTNLTKSQLIKIFEEAQAVKGVKEVKPTKKYIEVPREQLPVRIEGAEKGVSALEARMKGITETQNVKAAKREAETKGLDISVYDKMSKPEQLRAAANYVEKTPQYEVLEVLKGNKPTPKGLLTNAIMLALEQKSLRDRNVELAIKLSSLRSTRMGQEISILTEVEGTSPVSGMSEIIRARRDVATKKLKQGETIETKKTSAVKEISTEAKKFQLKLSEVENLLKSITC